jgi:hypothetical protein
MFKTISTLTLFGLLTFSAAQAQSSQPVRAQVPFAFEAQGATLPAGTYQVTYDSNAHFLTIKGREHAVFVPMIPSADNPAPSDTGKLVFHCQDAKCYLAAGWPSAQSGGPALQVSKSEPQRRMLFETRSISFGGRTK